MKSILAFTALLLLNIGVAVCKKQHQLLTLRLLNNTEQINCPPWMRRSINNTCVCEDIYERSLYCFNSNMTASLPFCYCISYNERFNTTVLGFCEVSCDVNFPNIHSNQLVHRYNVTMATTNMSVVNRALCGTFHMNRTGQLCGSCIEGYTPPVYSYDMACVECSDYKYNWLKYIAVAYLPLTAFYIIAVLFRLSATSGKIQGVILTSQILSSPPIVRLVVILLIRNLSNNFSTKLMVKTLGSVYGIWNLDFFRLIYNPFCVHSNMNTLQTLSLDYAVAIYPLVLIAITYILVCLHDRYRFVVWLWSPFYKCFSYIHKEWNVKSSLINAFATFILLSYVKVLSVSIDLLSSVTVFRIKNKGELPQLYLGVDATVEYFGKEHLPYALLALFMLVTFNIFPLILLCLYPCRCTQRCFNHLNLHSQALYAFMDAFQGPFKTHPRDYRFFATFYLLLRIINLTLMSLSYLESIYFPIGGIVMLVSSLVVAIVRPYRNQFYNNIDTLLLAWLSLVLLSLPLFNSVRDTSTHMFKIKLIDMFTLVATLQPLYWIALFIHTLLPWRKLTTCLSKVWRIFLNKAKRREGYEDLDASDLEDILHRTEGEEK